MTFHRFAAALGFSLICCGAAFAQNNNVSRIMMPDTMSHAMSSSDHLAKHDAAMPDASGMGSNAMTHNGMHSGSMSPATIWGVAAPTSP